MLKSRRISASVDGPRGAQYRSFLAWVLTASVALLLGAGIAANSTLVYLAILLPLAAFVWHRPTVGLVLYMAMLASVVGYQVYPLIGLLGGYNIYPHEVLALVLIARALYEVRYVSWTGRSAGPLVLAIACLAAIATAGIVSMAAGTSLGTVVNGVRGYALVAMLPTYAILCSDSARRRAVYSWAGVLVAVSAVLMLAQVYLGPRIGILPDVRLDSGVEEAYGIARSHPPGVVLGLLLLPSAFAAVLVRHAEARWVRWGFLIACVTVVVLSLTRTYWIAGLLAVAVVAVVVIRSGVRSRVVNVTMLVAVVLAVAVLLPSSGAGQSTTAVIASRFVNIFRSGSLEQGSLQDRQYELTQAAQTLERSPVWGARLGFDYGAVQVRYSDAAAYMTTRSNVHNAYVATWVYLGLPGFLAFVGLVVALLVAFGSRLSLPPGDSESTWWMGGLGSALAMAVAVNLANWFGNISTMAAVAAVLGLTLSLAAKRD